jgi:hypothetical protein
VQQFSLAQVPDIDLVIHVGDYIYDFVDEDERIRVPNPPIPDPTDVATHRARHAYYLLDPEFWGDLTISRAEDFDYQWTPAETYPDAIFSTSISGTLVETGEGGFAGSIPWDDGVHSYAAEELSQLEPGPVSFSASSYIEGPYFGLPFSTIQSCQSDSTLGTGAQLILE